MLSVAHGMPRHNAQPHSLPCHLLVPQAKYADDPETLQLETARMYKDAGVNPLAGCLPTLATIPVFIGLYNALSNAAKAGLLTDGFFWIPSLSGPTTIVSGAGSGSRGGAGLVFAAGVGDGICVRRRVGLVA